MTLCPNCGTCISDEHMELGCWTCGFSINDVCLKNEKRDAKEETKTIKSEYNISRLMSSVLHTGENNAQ